MSNVYGMIRSAYTFDPDVVSNETALDTGEDAFTQQCFKDECDINILLAKFSGNCPVTANFAFLSMLILRRRSIFKVQ